MTSDSKWLVVADAGRAQIYSWDRKAGALVAVPDGEMERKTKRSGQIMADRPGRSFDSHGTGRHAMEPRTPADRVAEEGFLRQLAEWLDAAAEKKRFTELVLVAPPRALGELRELMSAHVKQAITVEIDKDLTHETPQKLREHLADSL